MSSLYRRLVTHSLSDSPSCHSWGRPIGHVKLIEHLIVHRGHACLLAHQSYFLGKGVSMVEILNLHTTPLSLFVVALVISLSSYLMSIGHIRSVASQSVVDSRDPY